MKDIAPTVNSVLEMAGTWEIIIITTMATAVVVVVVAVAPIIAPIPAVVLVMPMYVIMMPELITLNSLNAKHYKSVMISHFTSDLIAPRIKLPLFLVLSQMIVVPCMLETSMT